MPRSETLNLNRPVWGVAIRERLEQGGSECIDLMPSRDGARAEARRRNEGRQSTSPADRYIPVRMTLSHA